MILLLLLLLSQQRGHLSAGHTTIDFALKYSKLTTFPNYLLNVIAYNVRLVLPLYIYIYIYRVRSAALRLLASSLRYAHNKLR